MGGFSMSSRRSFITNTILGAGAVSLGILPEELFASGDFIKLSVVHTNDMHCHFDPFPETDAEYAGRGGIVRLASVVEKYRAENPNLLLLDAGDMFQGTPFFNYFKGDLIMKVMSKMGYDAGTIGNHEFDNGLDDILSALRFANFPFVSSNYDFSDTILANKVESYHILKKSGIKIGLYGLGIELNGLVLKKNFGETQYLDPVQTGLKMEKLLKFEHSCDLIICLSHLGLSFESNRISDKKFAPQTQYTDLIVGGHTHTFLDSPLVLKNSVDKPVLINQAGWAALAVGKIDFVFDREKKKLQVLPEISVL
jgi:5'-nucleotidase